MCDKFLCKNLEGKEGEGVCSKGVYYWELTTVFSIHLLTPQKYSILGGEVQEMNFSPAF